MTIVTFTTLAGATVYYPPNGLKPRKVALESAFHAKLEAMFADLWARSPLGQAQWIGSLGCMVPSTPDHDTGRHNTGEAFDLSDVLWPDGTYGTSVSAGDPGLESRGEGPKRLARYLAVESVVRMHFQTALDWWYPDSRDGKFRHRDHLHIDTGRGEPTWQARSNQVRFLQASLRYVWGAEGLAIDGVMGAKTRAALGDVDFGAAEQVWPEWLEETARGGFAK